MPQRKHPEAKLNKPNRYQAIIQTIFDRHHKPGLKSFDFTREEFVEVARELNIALPKKPRRSAIRISLPVETA